MEHIRMAVPTIEECLASAAEILRQAPMQHATEIPVQDALACSWMALAQIIKSLED